MFGVSQLPSLNRIQIGQVCLYSCCALVAHLTSILLDQTINIESVDPVTHELVRVQVTPTRIQSVNPQGSVGTLVITTQEEVLENVRTAFCMRVCQFPKINVAKEFISIDSRRYIVSIEELNDAARQLASTIWS